jgi:uncharacterized membrane protein YfcA
MQGILDAVGWVPAVIFPMASLMQLGALLRRGRAEGVSALTWGMFALANVCLYLTIGEWGRPQVIATTLGSALVQAIIVGVVLRLRADKRQSERTRGGRA